MNFLKRLFKKEKPKKSDTQTKMVSSTLTGIPVQTRIGGRLTGAGSQQIAWCNNILRDMGKRKGMKVQIMGREIYMTRKEVEKHKAEV